MNTSNQPLTNLLGKRTREVIDLTIEGPREVIDLTEDTEDEKDSETEEDEGSLFAYSTENEEETDEDMPYQPYAQKVGIIPLDLSEDW